MKRLLLLRHAKSSWDSPGMPDKERPLNERGERASQLVGAYLAQQSLVPDVILCSTALRAQQTVHGLMPFLNAQADIEYLPDLYMADPGRIIDLIQEVEDEVACALVVGHNPGMQQAALSLATRNAHDNLSRLKSKFPTAGLALIEFDVDRWREIRSGSLVDFIVPKKLV